MDILSNGKSKLVEKNPKQGEYIPHYLEEPLISASAADRLDFSENRYPIFAYLFNKYPAVMIREADIISFNKVIERMRRYFDPLLNDFYEETKNIAWRRKQRKIFEFAYYSGELYIWYDLEEEEFSLYIKTSFNKDDPESENKFINIETNKVETFASSDELILFNWDGSDRNRFAEAFQLSYEMEAYLTIFKNQCFLFNKRLALKHEIDNETKVDMDLLKTELINLDTYITKFNRRTLVERLEPLITGADLQAYKDCIYSWFDREVSEFGRVANLNPKKERKTAGENYIAVDRQTDCLRSIFDNLELLAAEMSERGWPELIFKVNTEASLGIGETEAPTSDDATKTEDNSTESM